MKYYDYDKVKLGLWDRLRVWRERRIADRELAVYLKVEGNDGTGVDYSKANELEKTLLEKKKKDIALKQYLKEHKKDGTKEGYRQYLIENGLMLPRLKEGQKKPSIRDTIKVDGIEPIQQKQESKQLYYIIDGKREKLIFGELVSQIIMEKHPDEIEKSPYGGYDIKTQINDDNRRIELQKEILEMSLEHARQVIGSDERYISESKNPDLQCMPEMYVKKDTAYYLAKRDIQSGKPEEARRKLDEQIKSVTEYYENWIKKIDNDLEK